MLVSYFPKPKQTKASQETDIVAVLRDVQLGRWREAVEAVRALLGTATYDEEKLKLPAYTVSGTFTQRLSEALIKHSGLICLDVDKKHNPGVDLVAKRKRVEADSYTFACSYSVGGEGYSIIIPIPEEDHKGSFRALAAYYQQAHGLVVDPACSDVSRLRYVSYDPDLYLNESAATFEESLPETRPAPRLSQSRPELGVGGYAPRTNYGKVIIERACRMVYDSTEGSKHYQLRDAAHLCGGYIATGYVNEADAFDSLYQAIQTKPEVKNLKTAEATIRSGFKKGAQKPLLPDFQQRIVRQRAREGQPRELIVNALGIYDGIKPELLAPAIDAVLDTPNPTFLTFWKLVENEKKRDSFRLMIDRVKLRKWYNQEGFCRRPAGENVEWLRVVDNVVCRVKHFEVKQYAFDYVEGLPAHFDDIEQEDLLDVLLTQIRGVFDREVLQTLQPFVPSFVRDTPNKAHFFFQNGWVEVTAEAITKHPYAALPGLIWDTQKIAHDIYLVDQGAAQQCDFHSFMVNVTGKDAQRLEQLQKALGYLLHGYKEETNTKCIIIVDEVATQGRRDGRTGKSLLIKAVSKLVKVTLIPGENFRFDDSFRFQRIDDDTRIAYFDEWPNKRLSLDKLFTEIAADMAVNRKNQPEILIPFKDSPKFAITTNDVVTGEGGSREGRKIEIPLVPHYSVNYTPKDEFGTGFFDEGWDEDEWNRFFNLALGWVQLFLRGGRKLTQLQNAGLSSRKLEEATSPEFVEWAAEVVAHDASYSTGDPMSKHLWAEPMYENFLAYSGEQKTRFSMRRFYQFMARYGFERKKWIMRDIYRDKSYFLKPGEIE
ncbi:BT4734/BF3469 family protein [Hymenobacter sp. GOD-10R]|uniref:BT4734/BF3469 family protein n=1 Tax=Hymenobacter sp. GOD-10R TaxID=3093922 RepID=UPI002D78F3D9|nr:BT4734/BF3469 family protein [Hymenobacter sp. GOD-10R]WRQ29147.1 BT4734/BF3469 family protein [Hymenobacter sp. GOD-10R]